MFTFPLLICYICIQGRRSVGVEPSAEEQAALLQALKQEDERVRQDKEQTQLQREALRFSF